MSPLGFDAKKMYNFVAKRFINTSAQVQEQALNWLQTLTILQIMIPLTQLFAMFSDGVSVIQTAGSTETDADGETAKIDDELICKLFETVYIYGFIYDSVYNSIFEFIYESIFEFIYDFKFQSIYESIYNPYTTPYMIIYRTIYKIPLWFLN